MNSFDEIMEHCPFLKEVIENKIQEEVQARDVKIEELQATIKQQDDAIMELTTIVDTMGGV